MTAVAMDLPPNSAIVQTTGFSAAATCIARSWEAVERSFSQAISLDEGRSDVIEALKCRYEECAVSNWDGYGAHPVASAALETAMRFVHALPRGTAMPTVGAEPDGHLELEWYKSPRRVLSVSVAPDGNLHFAALLGETSRRHGSEAFLGEVPSDIQRLIRSVVG